jgi:hypothetical protein
MSKKDLFEARGPDERERAVLELEDQETLALIAKRDHDWRVRRAAALKLDDVALLSEILHEDVLPGVRGAAYARLRLLGVRVPLPPFEEAS